MDVYAHVWFGAFTITKQVTQQLRELLLINLRIGKVKISLIYLQFEINYINNHAELIPIALCKSTFIYICRHLKNLSEFLFMIFSLVHRIDRDQLEQNCHLQEIIMYGFTCLTMVKLRCALFCPPSVAIQNQSNILNISY